MSRPPAARPRLVGGALLVGLTASLLGPVGPAVAQDAPVSTLTLTAQVQALNARIDAVGEQLAADAEAYERAETTLSTLTQGQFAARSDAEQATAELGEAQTSMSALARAAYKGGVPPLISAFLSGDPGSVGRLAYVQRSVTRASTEQRTAAVSLVGAQRGAAQTLVSSDADRRAALLAKQALDQQLTELGDTARALTAELTEAATQLDRARVREAAEALATAQQAERARLLAALAAAERTRAAATAAAGLPYLPGVTGGGGGCQQPTGLEANGFLSDAGLCPLSVGGGHRLRSDAARAFDQMNAAYVASTGGNLCVTDSYRSYAAQVDVFARKPSLAATPGRSQHGWGLAIDFCGGVQLFDAPAHAWMQANAGQFGWVHPGWARQGGSRPEAWHWEFAGGPQQGVSQPGR